MPPNQELYNHLLKLKLIHMSSDEAWAWTARGKLIDKLTRVILSALMYNENVIPPDRNHIERHGFDGKTGFLIG